MGSEDRSSATAPRGHAVQFYPDDEFLAGVVGRYISAALAVGDGVIVIATPTHADAFRRRATELGADLAAAAAAGCFVLLDARATLAAIMDGDRPDAARFRTTIGGAIARCAAASRGGRVRAYGEMIELLWRDRKSAAALRLEDLWNELQSHHAFSLLCAYSLAVFDGDESAAGSQAVSASHDHVIHTRAEEGDLTERAALAIHWSGDDGRIIWASPGAIALLGDAGDEQIGRRLSELAADAEVGRDLLARLARDEILRDFPARVRRTDGSIRRVIVDCDGLRRDGAFVHTFCFLRDVTHEEARPDPAARERFRELFVGILGHDLRNPLAAITTVAAVLALRGRHHDGAALDEASASIVERISRSATRMSRMIDQILDFARIEAGAGLPLSPQAIDVADVCAAVIDELRLVHPERDIAIERRGETSGRWDLDRLSQMFSNLIGNALAYGDPAHPIRIRIEQEGDHVAVSVHNLGPVIPPDVLPAVFDPFRRAPPKQSRERGLGLGLYITKEIVRAHDGAIEARSTQDGGTTFHVRLPRARPALSDGGTAGS